MRSVWIGFDPREAAAFAVARSSIRKHLTQPIPVNGLVLAHLQARGLYRRPTEIGVNSEGRRQLFDVLSRQPGYDGRISTEHAIARFLVPHLAKTGWALFMDGDVMCRTNLARLFDQLDKRFAVYCVHHRYEPDDIAKMDGQLQTKYNRKNWSSVLAFNCDHEANRSLTVELVNTLPGRDLHRFCWLDDSEIGELDQKWNFLVGHTDPTVEPSLIHFTQGCPDMPGYENAPHADDWRDALNDWARGPLSFGS